MQEMNLYRLNSLTWKTACLCINSGDFGDKSKGTDYGAVAVAIANMDKGLVTSPNINKSKIGFKADIRNNKILFGLGAINGISMDLAREIVANAPFESVEDFIDKMVSTKIVGKSKMYNLIKSGSFDEFGSRYDIMNQYLNYVCPPKTKLSMQSFNKIMEYGLISDDENIKWYYFRKEVYKKENISEQINKTRATYRLNKAYEQFGISYNELADIISYDENGAEIIDSKDFNKLYDSRIKNIKEEIESNIVLDKFNKAEKQVIANKYCQGTVEKWEMDSCGFYTNHTELDYLGLGNYFNLMNFNDFSEEPIYYYDVNKYGKEYKKVKTGCICGVVVDKNKTKNIVTLATNDGTFAVKLSKYHFTHYDKKTDESDSWFKRGTMLVLKGFRNGSYFRLRKNRDDATELVNKFSFNAEGKIMVESEKN